MNKRGNGEGTVSGSARVVAHARPEAYSGRNGEPVAAIRECLGVTTSTVWNWVTVAMRHVYLQQSNEGKRGDEQAGQW